MAHIKALPAPKACISSKLQKAIELRVCCGFTVEKACKEAGLSRSGFWKAMKRPAVTAFYEKTQQEFIRETGFLKASAKAQAIEVAVDLMRNAKSETVRARMAEFLLSDGKSPQVAVHVDARQSAGYEFVRSGQQVVEIVDAAQAKEEVQN